MTDSKTARRVEWYKAKVVDAEVRLSVLSKTLYVLVKFGYDDSGEECHVCAALSLFEFPTLWSTTRFSRFEEVLGSIDIPLVRGRVSFTPDLTPLIRQAWVDKKVEVRVGFITSAFITRRRVVDIRKLELVVSGKE